MKRPWIRLYTEVPHDPKVQRLPDHLFKFWVNCLCLAGSNLGTLPPLQDMAWILKMPERQIEKYLKTLKEASLIETANGRFTPHAWNARQYESDVSSNRVREFRKRRGNVSRNGDETADETPPDTETDTETETEQIKEKYTKEKIWDADATFGPLVELYLASGKPVIDEDFDAAYRHWRSLDAEQQAKRIVKLQANLDEGLYGDPVYIPKPAAFVKSEWKRQLRSQPAKRAGSANGTRKAKASEEFAERMQDEFAERMRKEQEHAKRSKIQSA